MVHQRLSQSCLDNAAEYFLRLYIKWVARNAWELNDKKKSWTLNTTCIYQFKISAENFTTCQLLRRYLLDSTFVSGNLKLYYRVQTQCSGRFHDFH